MAQKDYVTRGRAPKKTTSQGRAKPTPANKGRGAKNTKAESGMPIPWLRLIITLALVAAFGYFLWSINGRSDDVKEVPVKQTAPAQATKEDPLPVFEEDEYVYPEELEESTVEVEVGEQQKSERPYLMQCGSFRQPEQAETMRANLAMQGLEAQVRASDGKNGRWYRVILGPYDYKRDAETDRHVIQRIGISTCQIWYWNL